MDHHSAQNSQQIETIKTSKALTVKALEVIQQLWQSLNCFKQPKAQVSK
jgi:hypothetical protein